VLAEAAQQRGDSDLAAQADAERATIVERIGPEVRGLAWARNLQHVRRRAAARARPSDSGPAALLTPREQDVVRLIAQGLTDRQIADRLVITEGTAGVHVGHILNKLGFHVRTEIATWAIQHNLGGM
jgi:DNA-binding NarL/FixJ family response regulator